MTRAKTLYYWFLGFVFALAIFLRVLVFSYRDAFEDDECRLLSAILDKSWLQLFLRLDDAQSAPPLFIIFERIWGCILGFGARSLKLIPLLSSIVSIVLFYKLSLKFLNRKYTILIANVMFAINIKLLYFSSVIKQYSNDVLFALICCLVFYKLDIMELSRRKLFFLSVFICVLPLISLPTLFFIASFLIMNLIKHKDNKPFYMRLLGLIAPGLITLGLYYCYNLLPSRLLLEEYFPNYWDSGLIGLSWVGFIKAQISLFKYLFLPNTYYLLAIPLFYIGVYFAYKENLQIHKYVLYVLVLVLLASVLKLYPIAGRVALYLVPFLILFFLKPLDSFDLKNLKFYVFLLCFLLVFGKYNFSFGKMLVKEQAYIDYSPKVLMQTLIKNYNPNTDVVLCNSASSASYVFYSRYLNFDNEEVYELPFYGEMNEEEIFEVLNSYKSEKRYWFYLIKDYSAYEKFPAILKWAKSQQIIFEQKDRDSYLILVKKLK